jgi:hypothetical protein
MKCGAGIPSKKRGRRRDAKEIEHRLFPEKGEESKDGWNMDVVDDEQCIFIQMRVEKVVLKFGERIPMGAIDKDELQAVDKLVARKGHLSRARDEIYSISLQQG